MILRRVVALLGVFTLAVVLTATHASASGYAVPSSVQFTAATSTSLTVTWTFGGASRNLDGFDVRLTDDAGNVVTVSAGPSARRKIVSGLACGTHYTGVVRSRYVTSTGAATGAWSKTTDVWTAVTGTAPCAAPEVGG